MLTRRPFHFPMALGAALALAGCESSGRFGGRDTFAPLPSSPVIAAPTARVEAAPLPPPVSSAPLSPPPRQPGGMDLSGLPPSGTSVPIDPAAPATPRSGGSLDGQPPSAFPQPPIEPATPPPPPPPPRAAPVQPQPAGPPTRTAVIGNWTAREAAGTTCRVTLSSTPALDLYRASSSGCQTRDLQRVNAWELRGDEVYLYEPGGAVAARLKQAGGSFQGATAKSGAPVTLSK